MKKTPKRDLFPGALEMMILQILRRQPSHGYALVQHIKRTFAGLTPNRRRLRYIQALQRLLKEELVKAEWGVSSKNRRFEFTNSPRRVQNISNVRSPASSACSKELPTF